MNKFQAARDIIRNRDKLIVVNDGMFRWVGQRAAVMEHIRTIGLTERTAREMSPDQYQALCDATTCESDRVATVGSGDLVRFVNLLTDRLGVDELRVG